MNPLLGISAMGLTRRGLETNGRFTRWGTPREHREQRIGWTCGAWRQSSTWPRPTSGQTAIKSTC